MIITQYTTTQSSGEVTGTTNGAAIPLNNALTFSAQCSVTVDTPAAKTFLDGVAALLVVQDLTYTAVLRGTAGNSITIAYVAGGTAGAEVVTVVGNAISISMDTGVSTATQIRTAFNLVAAATALATCSVSGTGSTAQVAAAAAPLATGVASAVNTTADTVTITAHGFTLGDKVRLTSNGTLPAGVTTGVDYFIIVTDANTIQFASSLVLALAGTAIDLTDQGSSGSTGTITPTSLAGATVGLWKSNDGTNWILDAAATAITVTAVIGFEKTNPQWNYYKLQFVVTAGQMSASSLIVVKGPQ